MSRKLVLYKQVIMCDVSGAPDVQGGTAQVCPSHNSCNCPTENTCESYCQCVTVHYTCVTQSPIPCPCGGFSAKPPCVNPQD